MITLLCSSLLVLIHVILSRCERGTCLASFQACLTAVSKLDATGFLSSTILAGIAFFRFNRLLSQSLLAISAKAETIVAGHLLFRRCLITSLPGAFGPMETRRGCKCTYNE